MPPTPVMMAHRIWERIRAELGIEVAVRMGGGLVKAICFQMRACYSGRIFARPLARLTQQGFLESMVPAFARFGGVFGEVRMDNHTHAWR